MRKNYRESLVLLCTMFCGFLVSCDFPKSEMNYIYVTSDGVEISEKDSISYDFLMKFTQELLEGKVDNYPTDVIRAFKDHELYGWANRLEKKGAYTIHFTINSKYQESLQTQAKAKEGKNKAIISLNPKNGHILAWSNTHKVPNTESDFIREAGSLVMPLYCGAGVQQGWMQRCDKFIDQRYCVTIEGTGDNYCFNDGMGNSNLPLSYGDAVALNKQSMIGAIASNLRNPKIPHRFFKQMGLITGKGESVADSEIGFNIFLGLFETTELNIASTYGTIMNKGITVDPIIISKITDKSGKIVYEVEPNVEEKMSHQDCFAVVEVLQASGEILANGEPGVSFEANKKLHGLNRGIKPRYAYSSGLMMGNSWHLDAQNELVTVVWVGGGSSMLRGNDLAMSLWANYYNELDKNDIEGKSLQEWELPTDEYSTLPCDLMEEMIPEESLNLDY